MLPTGHGDLRRNSHQLLEPLDLAGFDLNFSLALCARLKVTNRNALTANDEHAVIRLPEPRVEGRRRNAETARGLFRGEQFVGHDPPCGPNVAALPIGIATASAAANKSSS